MSRIPPQALSQVVNHFRSFLTDQRIELIDRNLSNRTRYLTVVLEDLFQPQNGSAVLRTCDCFGIQDVHVIETRNRFKVNAEVVRGATRWIDLHRYRHESDNTLKTIQHLKTQGYRVVATSPHAPDADLEQFDLSAGKVALVFGTEREGISPVVQAHADELIKIPMVGFTESFNISVSVAIILHVLTTALRKSDLPWQLSDQEKLSLLYAWYRNSLKTPELIERRFFSQLGIEERIEI
ncbi:TrmH family RNA methyltransferase [Breznakibacter xylanolyticus]|nr:RNA methyltransferase [Breznakibacter xylanolyticus]